MRLALLAGADYSSVADSLTQHRLADVDCKTQLLALLACADLAGVFPHFLYDIDKCRGIGTSRGVFWGRVAARGSSRRPLVVFSLVW